ncbi:DUF423 domain-containing protein [Geopsychrobacter electrodiphilus]|uniref:DUF423 domain-containing protein n=1 Tax=Geopsychrobacter electrodiphilus TaxID=225196 RepID=UPI00036A145A|nr:DUF423 domain-containing protein [Geopsychrobacter electrodiphilus]
MKLFLVLGGLNAFIGVALGAFGAHGLKSRVAPEMLTVWQTGVQYHLIHALALVLIGILCHLMPEALLFRVSGWAFLSGILLFSGSLYLMVLTGTRQLGMITPLGGLAFLLGWLLLVLAAWRYPGV